MRRAATALVLVLLAAPSARAQTSTVDPARMQVAKKMSEVRSLYYQDQMPKALDELGEIKGLLEGLPDATADERATVQLWRSAVYIALGDKEKARAEAKTALSYDFNVKVDLAVFPPTLKSLVDQIRAAGPIAAVTPTVFTRPNPAIAPPRPAAATPLVQRPLFWGAVGGVAVAALLAGLAASGAAGTRPPPGETDTTITVSK